MLRKDDEAVCCGYLAGERWMWYQTRGIRFAQEIPAASHSGIRRIRTLSQCSTSSLLQQGLEAGMVADGVSWQESPPARKGSKTDPRPGLALGTPPGPSLVASG